MSIQYRSTPKRKPRDNPADEFITAADFGDAVAAVNMSVADVAKAVGVSRPLLSEFRAGVRIIKPELAKKVREFFEAQGVEFIDADPVEGDAEDPVPVARLPRTPSALSAVLPAPTFAIAVDATLPEADREAALSELDAIVRANDRQLALEVSYEDSIFSAPELSRDANATNAELRQGLAHEAILRRVLAGSFKARYAEGQAATQADLLAQQLLGHLPTATSATEPQPSAALADGKNLAVAASADAAEGTGAQSGGSIFDELFAEKG